MRVSFVSVLLGFTTLLLLGSLFYFFSLARDSWLAQRAPPMVDSQTPTVAETNYSGSIVRIDELEAGFGSHLLVDSSGKTLAYLQSQKIDLRLLEGASVNLKGRKQRYIKANLPLLEVDSVSYRYR